MKTAFAGLLGIALLYSVPVLADTTYLYTGNAFDEQGSSLLPCPPVCNISGSITVASPLGTNLALESITPSSFSFTDGQVTLDNSNVDFANNYEIYAGTDATADINKWAIMLSAPVPAGSATILYTFNTTVSTPQGSGQQDGAVLYPSMGPDQVQGTYQNPGSWTITPEPSGLLLPCAGLLPFGVLLFFKRRQAALDVLSSKT